jgi:hypothetical protein
MECAVFSISFQLLYTKGSDGHAFLHPCTFTTCGGNDFATAPKDRQQLLNPLAASIAFLMGHIIFLAFPSPLSKHLAQSVAAFTR